MWKEAMPHPPLTPFVIFSDSLHLTLVSSHLFVSESIYLFMCLAYSNVTAEISETLT